MSPAPALCMSASPLRNPYSSGPQVYAFMSPIRPPGRDGLPLRNPHINNSFGRGSAVPHSQPLGMNDLPPSNPYLNNPSNGTLMAPGPPLGTPGSSLYNPYTNTQYTSTPKAAAHTSRYKHYTAASYVRFTASNMQRLWISFAQYFNRRTNVFRTTLGSDTSRNARIRSSRSICQL